MKNIEFSLFYKANLFISILLFLVFLFHNEQYTIINFPLTLFGLISSVMILYILLYIIFMPLLFTKKLLLYLSAFIFVIVDISIIVDFVIFKLFSFHINAMVLNILLSPDAFDSIQVGIAPIILFIILLFSLIIFEIYLIKILYMKTDEYKNILNRSLNKYITIPLIIIVFGEKFAYGFANLFSKNEIIHTFTVIPLYQPLTFRRIASKYFGFDAKKQASYSIKTKSKMNYPLEKLEINNEKNKFNIFIIASDSLKYTSINNKTSPNVYEFSKKSIVFNNHFSGGNATRFGIFSLFYGLNPTYWFSFLNANQKPVLFDVLKNLNYNINIVSSTNTNWPEFRKTAYVDIQDSISDDFKGSPWKKDEQSSKVMIDKIENMTQNKLYFSFLFLDAPHGYSFPPNMNEFNAKTNSINYLKIKKNREELDDTIKKYKNAVFYNDMLFGKIINILKEKNLYDNSLIIFTSDHGQEFFEHGKFGHNTSFSTSQTQVPFIVKLPKTMYNSVSNIDKLSSHQDVVPTIFSLLGVKNEPKTYSNGNDMLDKNFNRQYVFSSNWNNNAVITNTTTSVFSNLPNKMFNNEIRDTDTYKILKDEKANNKLLLDIIKENNKFLK